MIGCLSGGLLRTWRNALLIALFLATSITSIFIFSSGSLLAAPSVNDVPRWVDANTIRVGDSDFTYTNPSPVGSNNSGQWIYKYDDVYGRSGGTSGGSTLSCTSTLTFTYNPRNENGGLSAYRELSVADGNRCVTPEGGERALISIANADEVNANGNDGGISATGPVTAPGGGAPNQTAAGTTDNDPCDLGWNPLRWIVCPVVDGAHALVAQLDNAINTLMTVNTSAIFDRQNNETAQKYYQVWSTFRAIALGIIIIAVLVIIISTAFGFEFLDAYTIRKALPRVLLALLLVVLSWPILEFLITLINDVGNGLRSIIYSPFRDELETYVLGNGTLFVTNLVFAGGVLALGFFGLLSFALTAALAITVAFLVLVLREMLIIMLVLLAPVAIACFILPNTQKFWQLWQNTLTTLLVAFPIIAAFIALGRVFSVVAYSTAQEADGASKVINEIIAFLAYFIPYFLLPLAFRMAGGFMATLAGIANNSERGAFDRLKKYRQTKTAENTAAMKTGTRFQEHGKSFRNPITGNQINPIGAPARRFNRLTAGLGSGAQGNFGIGNRGQQAYDQQQRNSMADFMKTPGFQANQENDDALHAWTYNTAAEAKENLSKRWFVKDAKGQYVLDSSGNKIVDTEKVNSAIAAAQAGGGFGRPQAIAAAQQLGATGTGYANLDELTATVARASGGNKNTASAIGGYLNFVNKQKGRHDLAPGAANLVGDIHAEMGYGSKRDKALQMQDAWNSGSLYQIANGKKKGTQNLTEHIVNSYKVALESGDTDGIIRGRKAMMEMEAMIPNASGDNQNVLNDARAQIELATRDFMENRLPYSDLAMNISELDTIARKQARVYQRDPFSDPDITATRTGGP